MVTFNSIERGYIILQDEEEIGELITRKDKVWVYICYDEFGNYELESRDLKIIANKLDELNK